MYEWRPDGLFRKRFALIVLALRCKLVNDAFADVISSWRNEVLLLFERKPCLGDDGHDDDWLIDNRDRAAAFDFLRNIPGRVSVLQRPAISWHVLYLTFCKSQSEFGYVCNSTEAYWVSNVHDHDVDDDKSKSNFI